MPTPAAQVLLRLHRAGRSAELFAHLDATWLELWYAFEPGDLRSLVEQHTPPPTIGPSAALLVALTGAAVTAETALRRPAATDDHDHRFRMAADAAGDLRLRGQPQAALDLLSAVVNDVGRMGGALLDTSDGLMAIYGVQAGLTALLAGDLVAARGYFLRGTAPGRSARFPFAARDTAAKMALTHAVAGDLRDAREWLEHARAMPRTESWIEGLVDDTMWLVDYILVVDSLDLARAEEMRSERPSPMAFLELWGIALQAHVRHLVLTRRAVSAVQVCDSVEAAGRPQPGSDGWEATVLAEARLICRTVGAPSIPDVADASPWAVVARRVEQFAVGRFDEVTVPHAAEELHPHRDARPALALRLLRAQAMERTGRDDEARILLVNALEEVFQRGLLPLLRFLCRDGLEFVTDTQVGARAAALVAEHDLPLVEVVAILDSSLTPAEVNVLRLLVRGWTRAQIADELFLSVNTVKSQLAAVYRKLGVRNRAAAVVKAQQWGCSPAGRLTPCEEAPYGSSPGHSCGRPVAGRVRCGSHGRRRTADQCRGPGDPRRGACRRRDVVRQPRGPARGRGRRGRAARARVRDVHARRGTRRRRLAGHAVGVDVA